MSSIVPLSRRKIDWLFIVYFIIHTPITMLVDAQIVLPKSYFPAFAVNMLNDWVRDYDDVLTGTAPLFFKCFVWTELIGHLPFFIYGTYAFITGSNRVRNFAMMYAVQCATTMSCIIPEAWDRSNAPLNTKIALMSVLAIWAIMPVLLLLRVWNEKVFDYEDASSQKSKKKQ